MENLLLQQAISTGVECTLLKTNKQYPSFKKGDVLMLHVRKMANGKIQYYSAGGKTYHKSCEYFDLFNEIKPTNDEMSDIILQIIN